VPPEPAQIALISFEGGRSFGGVRLGKKLLDSFIDVAVIRSQSAS
jgi:hypothetical protein